VLAAVALLVGCPDLGDDPGDSGDSTGDAMPEPPPAPVFLEPASDQLDVPVARTQDIVLDVSGILPGTTRLLVDGISRGTLPASDPFATLTADALTLRPRGAMVEGRHSMQLVNDGAEDPLLSRSIEVRLVAEPPAELVFDPGEPALDAFAVGVSGIGPTAVLLVLHQLAPSAPWVHVVPADGPRWDYAQAKTIAILGYRRAAFEGGLAIAAELERDADFVPTRLRVAWRVGDPGTAIALVDVPWDQADVSVGHTIAFDLQADALGPYEYAAYGRPALIGDRLVAEVYAATDVESPRPGDHALVSAALHGVPAEVGTIERVGFGPRVDFDRLGRAIDPALLAVGRRHALAVRVDGVRPVVLVPDPDHGRLELRPGTDDDFGLALLDATGPVDTLVGAFGSRTIVAFDHTAVRPLSLLRVTDWGMGVATVLDPPSPLPDSPAGEPALGLIDGQPIVAIPYGEADDLHLVRPIDGQLVVDRIAASCTQVAFGLDPTAAAGTPVSLACVSGATVLDATLAAETDG
jgi:hypothetical protein